ncbi:hypothetical protein [Alloactinosynnema sp. L-07]|uniref:hypothetical protein n=1 Tax=Alloactinosynnema sp. L-07 TaxID=1653480 RepID=UPI00065F004F|nr:hypothetical protein [Alloactinosynnema sp. L-07]CRK59549.1 hypothetical protein [Alloactinosynnema sp. L-07]
MDLPDGTVDPSSGVSPGMILAGAVAFLPLDLMVLLIVHSGGGTALSTLVLLGLAVVGGLILILTPNRSARGFGIGLLLGWVIVTVASGGTFTGLG